MAMSDTGSDNPSGDISPTLREVARQFSAWQANRAKKREPIPDSLWQAAAAFASAIRSSAYSKYQCP